MDITYSQTQEQKKHIFQTIIYFKQQFQLKFYFAFAVWIYLRRLLILLDLRFNIFSISVDKTSEKNDTDIE